MAFTLDTEPRTPRFKEPGDKDKTNLDGSSLKAPGLDEAFEELEPVVVHDDGLGRAGDGVMMLEQGQVTPGLVIESKIFSINST